MCRNITILRGLEPAATPDEVEAVERAVRAVADATAVLLAELPERRRPPSTEPPLRRRAAAAG